MKRALFILALLWVAFLPEKASGGNLPYWSERLEKVGEVLGENTLRELPEGENYRALTFSSTPITVIKRQGRIEHIGYAFFTADERAALGKTVCNFLERYALEADLPLVREKDVQTQLLEDGVIFLEGSLSSLKSLCRDASKDLSLQQMGGRGYVFGWSKGKVLFPSDIELLSGRNMLESGRRLPEDIRLSGPLPAAPAPEKDELEAREDGVLVREGGQYYFASLTGNTYYQEDGTTPLQREDLPAETLSNLCAGLLPGASVNCHVKMGTYGLNHQYFDCPFSLLAAYALENGCKPYVGIIAQDEEVVEALIIYRNEAAGYNHVIRGQFPLQQLTSAEAQLRLTPFVPTHSIKYLFEEIKQ